MVSRCWIAAALFTIGTAAAAPPKDMAELLAQSPATDWRALDPSNTLYMQIPQGRVVIELAPQFAPETVDRNITVVGRVVQGIELLSPLRRGTGRLGFYEKAEERTRILEVNLAADLPPGKRLPLEVRLREG